MARLLQGQRLRFDEQTRGILGISAERGLCALVEREAGRMLIVRREAERLAPTRTIRFAGH